MPETKKILVVDDEVNFTKLLATLLKQRGYQPTVVQSGKEAIERIGGFYSPDLILMDLGLPDLPGDIAALRIKVVSKKKIPIIALTGHGDPLSEATTRAMGFDDYVVKPFDENDLIRRMEALLQGA